MSAANKIAASVLSFFFMASAMAAETKMTPGRWQLKAGSKSWVSTEVLSVDHLELEDLVSICISPEQAADPIDFFAGTFDEWRCSNPPNKLHSDRVSFAARCHHRFGATTDGSVEFRGSYTSTRFRLKHLTRFEDDHRQEEIEGRHTGLCVGNEDEIPYRPYRYNGMDPPWKPEPLPDNG